VTISTLSRSGFSKKPFLLLEVLISILIVSLCLVPLIQGPIFTYREEMRLLEEMERERIAELSFFEAKETLLNREIPWERLPSKGETSHPFSLSSKEMKIPGLKRKKVERSFTLHCTGEKEGKNGEIYRLLQVRIKLLPSVKKEKTPTYGLMVQKLPQSDNKLESLHGSKAKREKGNGD